MSESFRINISPSLINRLAEDEGKLKKRTKKPKPKTPPPPPPSQTKAHKKHASDDFEKEKGTTAAAAGWPVQAPLFMPVYPPPQVANAELEAIRSLLQESEKVMERLQKHEEEMAKEVTEKAKDLHDKEFKLPSLKPMPCLAEKNACLECYKEHLKDPLKCSNMVKSFADCARKIREVRIL